MASKLFISAKEVAKELEVSIGHESVEITYRYAHLFPTIQTEMAENLNQEREEYLDE